MTERTAKNGDTIIVSDNFEVYFRGTNPLELALARMQAEEEDEKEKAAYFDQDVFLNKLDAIKKRVLAK